MPNRQNFVDADGKPNLPAKVPRTLNGKPDLSGVWQMVKSSDSTAAFDGVELVVGEDLRIFRRIRFLNGLVTPAANGKATPLWCELSPPASSADVLAPCLMDAAKKPGFGGEFVNYQTLALERERERKGTGTIAENARAQVCPASSDQ